jgi:hypothetical protein
MYVLNAFRFTRRFVDDLTAACNPFLKYLLYTNNSILGGLIQGIYPHGALVLEPTRADMWAFPTLDIRIVSRAQWVLEERDGRYYKCVRSHSILYDKRREKCYDGIPIAQYTHVSSDVGESVGSSIILGQLHRFRELIQVRDDFVYECGLLLAKMQNRGIRSGSSKTNVYTF